MSVRPVVSRPFFRSANARGGRREPKSRSIRRILRRAHERSAHRRPIAQRTKGCRRRARRDRGVVEFAIRIVGPIEDSPTAGGRMSLRLVWPCTDRATHRNQRAVWSIDALGQSHRRRDRTLEPERKLGQTRDFGRTIRPFFAEMRPRMKRLGALRLAGARRPSCGDVRFYASSPTRCASR